MQGAVRIMKKTNKLLVIFSVFISMILSSSVVFAEVNTGLIDSLTQDERIKIEKFIEENMDKGKIPGLSIAIVKDDKTIYQKGFGYSNIEEKTPVTDKTLFELGSTSKAFTGLGILKLEQDGLIKLGDDVSKYIPWFRVNYKGQDTKITLEQLLHHSSGIPFKTIDKIPVSNEDDALEQTVKTLVGIELDSTPGEKFQYATINYDVLGLVIEKVSGVSYEKYMEENVIKPSGLINTYLFKNEAVSKDIATGYKLGFLKPRSYDAPVYRGNKPAGYIITNGEDMAKWLKIQMGVITNPKFDNDLIIKTHIPNRTIPPEYDGSSYAAGWNIYQIKGGQISHGGNNPNYSSYVIFRPEDKEGVAVLSNISSEYTTAIAQGVNQILKVKEYNKDIKDLGKVTDHISILIIFISSAIIIGSIYYIVKMFREILKKERILDKQGIKTIYKICVSLIFMCGLSYSIYLIPYILYDGVSWGFVFVWLPISVKVCVYMIYISIWLAYSYFLLLSLYKKDYDKPIFLLSMLSVVSGFGNALIIFTINMAVNSSNFMRIKLLVYFTLGIVLYVGGQKVMRSRLINLTNDIVYSKRMKIIKVLLKTSHAEFEKIDRGVIESTLNNDTETISRFPNIIISGITSLVTLICCFMYLGFINIYALCLSALITLAISSLYYLVARYANKIGEQSRTIQSIFFKFINHLIDGFKELSLNEKRKKEFELDVDYSCNLYKINRKKAAIAFSNMFVLGELLFTFAIGVIVIVFPLILKKLETQSITSYVFVLLYMVGPVHGILDAIPSVIEVRISFKRVESLLNKIEISRNEESNDIEGNIDSEFSLNLNDVEYEYESSEENNFKVGPINCEFKSGEVTFIIGGNGSGKSTLAKLIIGLYPPTKGYITLNDNKISAHKLRECYSAVFSDFHLFDKLYGIDYENKKEEIEKYLKLLRLDNKLEIKEGKFSTTKLSTGQKKRLALLITYLEDKPIYMFDEWAADQDPEFRAFFYKVILPELKNRGKCVIAITHDDYYFNFADKFIKMDSGNVKICKKLAVDNISI